MNFIYYETYQECQCKKGKENPIDYLRDTARVRFS